MNERIHYAHTNVGRQERNCGNSASVSSPRLAEKRSRRAARGSAEIVDEVRLVEVTRSVSGGRDIRAAASGPRVGAARWRNLLGGRADHASKPALERTLAQADVAREIFDRWRRFERPSQATAAATSGSMAKS